MKIGSHQVPIQANSQIILQKRALDRDITKAQNSNAVNFRSLTSRESKAEVRDRLTLTSIAPNQLGEVPTGTPEEDAPAEASSPQVPKTISYFLRPFGSDSGEQQPLQTAAGIEGLETHEFPNQGLTGARAIQASQRDAEAQQTSYGFANIFQTMEVERLKTMAEIQEINSQTDGYISDIYRNIHSKQMKSQANYDQQWFDLQTEAWMDEY